MSPKDIARVFQILMLQYCKHVNKQRRRSEDGIELHINKAERRERTAKQTRLFVSFTDFAN